MNWSLQALRILAMLLALEVASGAQTTVQLSWVTVVQGADGWRVARVVPAQGWQAPLVIGDSISSIEGHSISKESPLAVFRLLQTASVRQMKIGISNGSQVQESRLFANRPDALPAFQKFGMGAAVSDIDDSGFSHVRKVVPNGPADIAGLKVGDAIKAVNGKPLNTLETTAFLRMLSSIEPKPLDLAIDRGGEKLSLHVVRDRRMEDLIPETAPPLPRAVFTTEGVNAPEIDIRDANSVLKLSALHGQWTLLVFWASWCAPCLHEIPTLNELTFKSTIKLVIWGVAIDEHDSLNQFIRTHSIGYPLVNGGGFDGDVAQKYFVSALPMNVLIDPNGDIRWVGDEVPNVSEIADGSH